jgi:pimeloyl-ACP methyl ester carboxylesterase
MFTKVYPAIFLLCICLAACRTKNSMTPLGNRSYTPILAPIVHRTGDTLYHGSYEVFENRQLEEHKISLYIMIIPSKNPSANLSPIFFFSGGPGDAATDRVDFFMEHRVFRENRDIVLIDSRGTGRSNPLHCPSTQVRKTASYCMDEMYPVDSVTKCFDALSKVADLSQYTTEIVIDDVEEIRRWLGYDTINIWGQSYGTRACQAYQRQYPNAIRSSVMEGVVPTSMAMPLNHASDGQKAWELLLEECVDDSLCNARYPLLAYEFEKLFARLQKASDTFYYVDSVHATHERVEIAAGPLGDLIRSIMYSVSGRRRIPYLVHEAYGGNYRPLIEIAIDRNSAPYSLADGFYLCVTCSEDVPYITTLEADELTQRRFLGRYRIDQQVRACEVWGRGIIQDTFRVPITSDIPTLVISGGVDPITPPHWGELVIQQMSQAQHLVIPQMAHGVRGLTDTACFYKLIDQFFRKPNSEVTKDCIKLMKPVAFR